MANNNGIVDIPLSRLDGNDDESDSDSDFDDLEEQPPATIEEQIDPVRCLFFCINSRTVLYRLNLNGFHGCGFIQNAQQKKVMKYVMQLEKN
jgi:hypothetical protein